MKKYICFFLYLTCTSICFSMHQLTQPALIQISKTIIAITPQLKNALRNCATNSSTPEAAPKNEPIENKSAKIKEEDLAQLLQQILAEQKEQTELLREIKGQDDSFFASFISRRTMLWFMMFSMMFGIPGSLSSIKEKLNNTNSNISSVNRTLNNTNNKLETINNILDDIKFKKRI